MTDHAREWFINLAKEGASVSARLDETYRAPTTPSEVRRLQQTVIKNSSYQPKLAECKPTLNLGAWQHLIPATLLASYFARKLRGSLAMGQTWCL